MIRFAATSTAVLFSPVAERRQVGQQAIRISRPQREQVHHLQAALAAGQRALQASGDGRVAELVVSGRRVEHDEA
jgi:hypothetical protein